MSLIDASMIGYAAGLIAVCIAFGIASLVYDSSQAREIRVPIFLGLATLLGCTGIFGWIAVWMWR